MAKRYIKQKYRSYRHKRWASNGTYICLTANEVKTHVVNARRPDADPLFNEIANEAALNGIDRPYCGEEGICFLQPTDNPRGYYSLLKLILKNKAMFRSEISKAMKCKLYTTLSRLVDGKLLNATPCKNPMTKRPANKYSLSELGKIYLQLAQKYVVKRQTKKKQFS